MISRKTEEIEDEIRYLAESVNAASQWARHRAHQLWVSLPEGESEDAIEKAYQEVDQEIDHLEKQIQELENRIS